MQMQSYAAIAVELAREQSRELRDGRETDFFDWMMRLTLNIVARTLLTYDISPEADVFQQHLDKLMNHVLGIARSGMRLPLSIPTPANVAARNALQYFDAIIYGVIQQRRATASSSDDLVSLFLSARDENGNGLTDLEIRDELLTMLLVGHDTSALGLTFACWLLAQHPEASDRLVDEVDAVIGGELPGYQHVGQLPYTEAVWKETLRLYPPVWAMGREALRACEVGGYAIRPGAQVLLSPWVSHRNPRFFDDPTSFLPERWLDGRSKDLPPFAYFPFGGGPRMCIGYGFARMESLLVLATLAQRFRLRPGSLPSLRLLPTVTLRPRHAVKLRVEATRSLSAV
jgi:cytochrome P450